MQSIPESEVERRIAIQNPWWQEPTGSYAPDTKRAYFELVHSSVLSTNPRRALVLMGPRRVGKTVMLKQSIKKMIDDGVSPKNLCYVDLQVPLYNRRGIEELLECGRKASGSTDGLFYMFIDEVQYLPNWEMHLKSAVDHYGNEVKFIVSGSAAAALKLKSDESGAGRFTDFLLPPVTFYEFLKLIGHDHVRIKESDTSTQIQWDDTDGLNEDFFEYMNYGGYPEAIFSNEVRKNASQFIGTDIIEKVLLKDLPSLYGIQDVQELNALFTTLAYNTSNEINLDKLSQQSGVAKNTIKRYIEYLESAFLIKVLHRVDKSAKRFKRANFFKVYLTNPCMRSALFGLLSESSENIGAMCETAVVAQWFHSIREPLFYARWDAGEGEVDLVRLSDSMMRPEWAVEVKWTDRPSGDSSEIRSLSQFLKAHPSCKAKCTTKSYAQMGASLGPTKIDFWPTAIYAYYIGYNVIKEKRESKLPVSF